jgi:serine/threonine-protein kinase
MAEQLYREGIPIMQNWYGPDHPDVATCSSFLARLLIAEKKPDEAESILLRVLPIQEKTYGPVHERVAFTLDALGTIAMGKDDLPTAEADFSRAVAAFRSTLGNFDTHTGISLGNLGAVYLKEARYALAEATLRQAVEVLKTLPPGNNLIGTARARWGRSLLALKRYPEAEEQLTAARDLLNAQRTPPPIDVANVRSDLAALSVATHRSGKAIANQTELADRVAPPVSH